MASTPRTRTIRAALGVAPDPFWLVLTRHDEDGGDGGGSGDGDTGSTGTDDDAGTGSDDDAGDDKGDAGKKDDDDKPLGDKGQKALKAERDRATKAERELREANRLRKAAEEKVAEFEDRDKDELTKAQEAAQKAADRAAAAERRAVLAEIRALASADFADVSDATDALSGRLAEFVGADGEIDADAITAALTEKLDAKPHWRKPAAAPQGDDGKKRKGDAGQGSGRGGAPAAPDFSDPDQYAAEARKLGLRVSHRPPTR